jgi:hypothetical protein
MQKGLMTCTGVGGYRLHRSGRGFQRGVQALLGAFDADMRVVHPDTNLLAGLSQIGMVIWHLPGTIDRVVTAFQDDPDDAVGYATAILAGAWVTKKAEGCLAEGAAPSGIGKAPGKFPKTPSDKINRWTRRQGGYIDPETNTWVEKPIAGGPRIESGHIYPSSRIKDLPGFEKLTRAQQDWLLNHPDNFIPLTKQWNSSMGNQLADQWAETPRGRLASKEFIDQLRETQQAFEGFANEMIKFWLGE